MFSRAYSSLPMRTKVVSSRRTIVASTVSRRGLVPIGAAQIGVRRACGCAAARRRTRACARTCRRPWRAASRGGSGTACGRARRGRSPAGGRSAACRSRPPRRPAGSPARGCAAARRHRGSLAVGADVAEAVAVADAPDARLVVADPDEARRRRRLRRRGRRAAASGGRALTRRTTIGGGGRGGSCDRAGRAGRTSGSSIGGFTPCGFSAAAVAARGARAATAVPARAVRRRAASDRSSMRPAFIPAKVAASDAPGRPSPPGATRRGVATHEERPVPRALGNDGTPVALLKPSTPVRRQAARPQRRIEENEPMNFPPAHDQKQQHTVTPRLQHAVRLLQLSSLDFAQEVQDAMGRTPSSKSRTRRTTPRRVDAGDGAAADGEPRGRPRAARRRSPTRPRSATAGSSRRRACASRAATPTSA